MTWNSRNSSKNSWNWWFGKVISAFYPHPPSYHVTIWIFLEILFWNWPLPTFSPHVTKFTVFFFLRASLILFCVWLVFKKIILLISFSGATKTADIHHMEDKVHEVQCVLTKKVGVAVNIRIHTSIIINTVSWNKRRQFNYNFISKTF